MNKVMLVGRLTKDPECRTTQNGNQFARFSIAVNRTFKNAEGKYDADFPNCVCYGKTAEFISKYFKKGMMIGIIGKITTGSYQNKDGVRVYTTDVTVDEAEFVESKNSNSGRNTDGYNDNKTVSSDFVNIPDAISDEEELPFN